MKKETTKDEINAAMKAAAEGPMKGILEYCNDPIVSIDVDRQPALAASFDSLLHQRHGRATWSRCSSWYDNEWGFSQRVVDALLMMA